jgi:hypothetical protein
MSLQLGCPSRPLIGEDGQDKGHNGNQKRDTFHIQEPPWLFELGYVIPLKFSIAFSVEDPGEEGGGERGTDKV